jgi:hypothetical protein
MAMVNDDPNKNAKRLVVLFWVVVAFYYFAVAYDYISKEMKNDRLADYAQKIVQLAGNETRTPKEVRALLMVKADELRIPLEPSQIQVLGSGASLKVTFEYDVTLTIPIFNRGFYSKHYEHNVSYKDMRF